MRYLLMIRRCGRGSWSRSLINRCTHSNFIHSLCGWWHSKMPPWNGNVGTVVGLLAHFYLFALALNSRTSFCAKKYWAVKRTRWIYILYFFRFALRAYANFLSQMTMPKIKMSCSLSQTHRKKFTAKFYVVRSQAGVIVTYIKMDVYDSSIVSMTRNIFYYFTTIFINVIRLHFWSFAFCLHTNVLNN